MDIKDSVRKGTDEYRRKQTHKARQTHQPNLSLLEFAYELAIVIFARREQLNVSMIHNNGLKTSLFCPLKSRCLWTIGYDNG